MNLQNQNPFLNFLKNQNQNILKLKDILIICQNYQEKKDHFILYPNYNENDPHLYQNKDGKSRRIPLKWTIEEQEFLLNGFRKFDTCWTQILKEFPLHPIRGRYDLKDKWKNILKKENDPNLTIFFKEISEIKEKRNLFISHSSLFMKSKEKLTISSTEQNFSIDGINRIKKEMQSFIPFRHLNYIYRLLENEILSNLIIEKWKLYLLKNITIFEFLEFIHNLKK